MDHKRFKENIGRTFQFVPPPRRDSASGSWESDLNIWILQGETADKKGFAFLNAFREHAPLVLDLFQMRNFDAPDKLVLRGQVILKDTSVIFEPFHPKPASIQVAKLCLYLNGAEDDAQVIIASPLYEYLQFYVVNHGEQTVRDYRNTILIPNSFTRESSSSVLGNLIEQKEVSIDKQIHIVYENFIPTPIFKNERIRIGDIGVRSDPGDYIFRWKIRCDEGSFPAELTYGEIKVKVISR